MTGYIYSADGAGFKLPPLYSYRVEHSAGEACDCFELTFPYTPDMASALYSACRFRGEYGGGRVFTGVVDEYEASLSEEGMVCTLTGRGMAALLLDNEAMPTEYYRAALPLILDKHVKPFGVTDIKTATYGAVARFTVETGDSQWKVLRSFCALCGAPKPRFDRQGVLLLDGSAGRHFRVTADTAVCGQSFRDTRYGVISAITLRSRYAAQTVRNEGFIARGGSAARVLTVPRYANADSRRYTGEYQIARSELEAVICTLTLPRVFAAFAGDRLTLEHSPLGVTGDFRVLRSRTRADADGGETTLELIGEDRYVAF